MNDEWVEQGAEVRRASFRRRYDEIDELLTRNRIFIDRTKGIGVLTQGGCDQLRRDRADRAGERRGARFAQGRAVSGVSAISISR